MTFKPKYKELLKDKEISRWFENLRAKSYLTATVYLRGLGYYCELTESTPYTILEDANSGKLRNDFMDFVRKMEREGKAGSYIARYKKVLRSWLGFNGTNFKFAVNIAYEGRAPRVEGERSPEKTELAKILRSGSPRARLAISLLAFSGLRPETLGNAEGTDGLKVSDFPEMRIDSGKVEFDKAPTMVSVRYTLSKAKNSYFTFLSNEGMTYLREYMEKRISDGDVVTPETPLFKLDPQGRIAHSFIRTQLATRDIRKAIVSSGFSWRPYVLRAYFATALDNAENKGLISHPWRMFFMGHKGDIEARYSTNKRLPLNMIEEMRESYRKCTKFLETRVSEPSENEAKTYLQQQLLLAVGYKQEEIDKIDLVELDNEAFQKLLRDKVTRAMAGNGSKQRLIDISEVGSYLDKGYEFQASLPNGKAVMKLPF